MLLQMLMWLKFQGNADQAEDVAGGLQAANAMLEDSESTTKLVAWLGDAPAHGSDFHDGAGDRWPGGDPNGRDPRDYLRKFGRHHVDFNFVQIDSSTDKVY